MGIYRLIKSHDRCPHFPIKIYTFWSCFNVCQSPRSRARSPGHGRDVTAIKIWPLGLSASKYRGCDFPVADVTFVRLITSSRKIQMLWNFYGRLIETFSTILYLKKYFQFGHLHALKNQDILVLPFSEHHSLQQAFLPMYNSFWCDSKAIWN